MEEYEKLNKCVELFDSLSNTERLIVIDHCCIQCGRIFHISKLYNGVCIECRNKL